MLVKAAFIWSKYSKNANIVKHYNMAFSVFNILKNRLRQGEFQKSLLQFSESHDPSETILIYWFAAQETFLIIISVENILLSYI